MKSLKLFPWISNALFLAGAAAVAYLIIGLAAENRDLKAQLAQERASPLADSLAPGDAIPAVAVSALDGSAMPLPEMLEHGGVVVYLTTTCPYCRQTLPTWDGLAERYEQLGVPFVGVSLHDAESTRAYVTETGIDWPMGVLDAASSVDPKVRKVPFTVLVGSQGVVDRVWLGPLVEEDVEILQAALEGELADSHRVFPGSPAQDPDCCEAAAPGTGATLAER